MDPGESFLRYMWRNFHERGFGRCRRLGFAHEEVNDGLL
jgi:hypothetical protein